MGIIFEREKDLEDLLYEHMENGTCLVTGDHVVEAYRQVDSGGYGIIDLLSICVDGDMESGLGEPSLLIHVYELKNGPIKIAAVQQIARYRKAMRRALDGQKYFSGGRMQFHLIGNAIDTESDMVYVADSMPDLTLWTFSIDPESGIEFEDHEGWYLKNEDLNKLAPINDAFCNALKARSSIFQGRKEAKRLEAVK